jgi:tRNA pseudouridine-54 N-methylase
MFTQTKIAASFIADPAERSAFVSMGMRSDVSRAVHVALDGSRQPSKTARRYEREGRLEDAIAWRCKLNSTLTNLILNR